MKDLIRYLGFEIDLLSWESEQKSMQGLKFNNQFTSELPSDPNDSPAERLISNALFARVAPKKPASPYLIHYSQEVA